MLPSTIPLWYDSPPPYLRYAALHHAGALHHLTNVEVNGGVGVRHGEGEGRACAPGADLGTLSQDMSDGP